MKIVNTDNAEHYKWGDDSELGQGSDGWHLLKSDSLSIIEESVPSGQKEQRHYHQSAQQFFYVLSGTAEIEISGSVYKVDPGNGIHVPAGEPHQLMNNGTEDLRFLVVSQPASHNDRITD